VIQTLSISTFWEKVGIHAFEASKKSKPTVLQTL
jgi:hypothetical protein